MVKRQSVKTYKVKSPAKINTGLRVLSKRKDGFHNIETIFYPVKLYDTVEIRIEGKDSNSKSNTFSVKTNSKIKIDDKDNICYKALTLFFKNFKISGYYNIKIRIRKSIPIGAGMGGGSSDAASALKILAGYFSKTAPADKKMLFKTALELGSDVPFFLISKPSYGTGRGGILKPLKNFKISRKILIVNPGIHISTSKAYKALKIRKNRHRILNRVNIFDTGDKRLTINDFERRVFREYPEIETIKYDMFRFGAGYSLMSGSGSTVFGLFSANKITGAYEYFKNKGYSVFYG